MAKDKVTTKKQEVSPEAEAKKGKKEKKEKKDNPGPEPAKDPIQLEMQFHDRVADAVYTYRLENRKKGLEMILKGFALIGATHETTATMLDRIWQDVPELRQALDEMKGKKGK